jgi:hypothetical protein
MVPASLSLVALTRTITRIGAPPPHDAGNWEAGFRRNTRLGRT